MAEKKVLLCCTFGLCLTDSPHLLFLQVALQKVYKNKGHVFEMSVYRKED